MGVNIVHGYTATIISSANEIRELCKASVSPPGSTDGPLFFLAGINPRMWTPRVVVVRRGKSIVGFVYTKELTLAGIKTGVLYGDNTLSTMIVGSPRDRPELLRIALATLLKSNYVRGIRLLVPPDSFEIETIYASCGESAEVRHSAAENHSYLPLPGDYETFTGGLGARTRRNIRYYRRRFADAGHTYIPNLGIEGLEDAVKSLSGKSVIGADAGGIARALNVFSSVSRPWFAGLRHRDGSWLSVIGGWQESDDFTVFLQMNDDRGHPESSLSLVMRSYVIEELIANGVPRLRFWAGVGGSLARHIVPVPAKRIYLDRPVVSWRFIRLAAQLLSSLFPRRLEWVKDWVLPPTQVQPDSNLVATPEKCPVKT